MENRNNAHFAYQATQISTATKEQLLLIIYDIGIKACRMAEAALTGLISLSISFTSACAKSCKVLYLTNKSFVTIFTLSSVH